MTTTLYATFNDAPLRPPQLIRSAGGYFYSVCHADGERFTGFIVWNNEVLRVRLICDPEGFYDRFNH